ncbi:MAG TPA: GntR family transcriptional regulator [Bacillota bacterium]|nr:GntR family transcriptional regulator [Bacillota bacterium]HOH09830.1 GntR family transcriptional regulator [Bacillota bacterium]HOY89186.1 GntR family transcriptional regulator [Bacillota bacterium]HPI00757.1 GntR family transcriptional regulator [Bacillota bacterium]HPM64210.1 GntR family transcriptional regulator [Bacillota bacterium]
MSRCRTDKAGDKRRQVKSNDKLPAERELASTLGVSRVPVRETLGMLRILGIIETGYGKGAVVKGLEKSRLLETIDMLVESKKDTRVEVTEAQAVLEVAAVKIASLRGRRPTSTA